MILKYYISIMGLCLLLSCESDNDDIEPEKIFRHITAGDSISESIIFKDILDTTIQVIGHLGSHFDFYSINMDLTNDDSVDYKFFIDSRGGLGAYSICIGIIPLANNYIAVDTFVTIYNNNILSPKVLFKGDIINEKLNFKNNIDSITLSYFCHIVDNRDDYFEGFWNNKIDNYIGIKMIPNKKDTLWGWIKIDVVDCSKITIKEYAFRK